MEVQIHSNCIPSSFYTLKLARITRDSQSQVLFLYFTRSCHLPVSICLTISSNTVHRIYYCKNLQTCQPLLIYIVQVFPFQSDSTILIGLFQRNLGLHNNDTCNKCLQNLGYTNKYATQRDFMKMYCSMHGP